MARFLGLLLCACLLAPAVSWAAEPTDQPFGVMDIKRSQAHLEVSRGVPGYTNITLNAPDVVIEDRVADYRTYRAFGIPGEPSQFAEGCPTVPRVSRFYRIPNTGGVDLAIQSADFDVMDDVDAYPFQIEGSGFGDLAKNTAVYSTDGWYPANVAEVSEPMIMRDFRVVIVTLYPVQVNPVTRQARIYRNISVDLVANDQPGTNELLNPHQVSGAYANRYRAMIANLDESALDDATTTPGTYLIVTTNTLRAYADTVATWKLRKGYTVRIESRATWTSPSAVQTFIRSVYNNASTVPPLEWVAIMGDPYYPGGAVPCDDTQLDHLYALGNAGDEIEDFGVGRLSGETAQQMLVIQRKILAYESDPWMQDTSWFHNAFLIGDVAERIASNCTLMLWGAHQFQTHTDVDCCHVQCTNGGVDGARIVQEFARGICFFVWRGSYLFQMDQNQADQTNPGRRLPVCLGITCGANNYSGGTGIMERFLQAGDPNTLRGGVCAVGTSGSGTHAPQNITVTGGWIYAIADLGIETPGHCLNVAKDWLVATYGPNDQNTINFSNWNNLMGDPGLSMWTAVPVVMAVSYPAALNVGARELAVTVTRSGSGTPIQDALVVAWKRGSDSTYVKALTDEQGQAVLPIHVRASGDLWLTVTKRQHKPYLATIPCSSVDQMVSLSSYTLDDDNAGGTSGNSNGLLNPGETIDLPVYLRNFGTSVTATGITATMTSDNPRVTVTLGTISYPNLAPGDSALGASAFRIQVSSAMQNGETVLLSVNVSSAAGQTPSCMTLTCQAGALAYSRQAIESPPFNPGTTRNLRVTIRNRGVLPRPGVVGHLTSFSPFVQVEDGDGSFGDVANGDSVTNTNDPFTLTANTLTFRGHQAPMRLILNGSSGSADTVQFIVSVGTATTRDPTGPDAYGYYAYDNTDTSYEMHPTYSYVNISGGLGTNLNINDPGEEMSPTPVYSTVRRLPFGFKFYGHVYDTVTICSNGWMAFGNQGWNDLFRNYPIPAMQAPDAMIAPYWDDLATSGSGRGVWMYSDTANHRFIVQWKGAGGSSYSTSLDFEAILYDTTAIEHRTFSGDGKIVVQYNVVQMGLDAPYGEPAGCAIGIQDEMCTVGLSYVYQTTYSPGAASVVTGRAILFTTDARMMFGTLEGHVTDAETHTPVRLADVRLDGFAYHAVTDNEGFYQIPNILIGTYNGRASLRGFNDATATGIVIVLDSTTTVDFSLLHPELTLSSDTLTAVIRSAQMDTSVIISNGGNGPLTYSMQIFYAGDENPNPWDRVDSIEVTALTENYQIQGVEFAGDGWWISGGGGPGGQNRIFKFDRHGHFLGSIPQPGSTPMGWFDLAWDGRYLYGSDGGTITAIDTPGTVQRSFSCPVNPGRALAFDPATRTFWVADYTTDLYNIDSTGHVLGTITNPRDSSLAITGLAWNATDPNGFKLYVFSQDGGPTAFTRVTRFHPVSRVRQFVADLPARPGDRSGGCAITPGYNSVLIVFAGIHQNPAGDRLGIYEMQFNTSWIGVTPTSATVPAGAQQALTVHFDRTMLLDDTYRVNLHISNNTLDSLVVLPVVLCVPSLATPEAAPSALPLGYALYQNYPNPFNPTTEIRFDLRQTGHVQLRVFNTLGQVVATLVDETRSAGVYRVAWDGENVASGLYIYQLKAGDFVDSKKMLLIR